MSDTPETQKLFDWFYSRNADRVSSFIGINRVQARVEDMERERDEARAERDEWIARFRADEELINEAMLK